MNKEILTFGDTEIKKHKFHSSKYMLDWHTQCGYW